MTNDSVFTVDEQPPGVVLWFKVYAAFLAIIYLGCAGLSLIFFLVDPAELEMDAAIARLVGVLLLVFGLGLAAVFLLPLFAPLRPWVWIYDLVLICLGMTSVCFWPATIPLLIFWLKPETKRHFDKR